MKKKLQMILMMVGVSFGLLLAGATAATAGATVKISFTSERDGNQEIYIMNPDGSNQTRLTNSAGIDQDPSISPDGTKIAFTSSRDGNLEIYLMNSDGTSQINLTNNPATDYNPAFSPDGAKIASHRSATATMRSIS